MQFAQPRGLLGPSTVLEFVERGIGIDILVARQRLIEHFPRIVQLTVFRLGFLFVHPGADEVGDLDKPGQFDGRRPVGKVDAGEG